MKSKIFFYLPILLLLLFSVACSDDPVSPGFSIEDKINSNKPFERISIGIPDSPNYYFEKNGDGHNIVNAYAENGFLVVVSTNKEYYFNLSTAKNIETRKNYVGIQY